MDSFVASQWVDFTESISPQIPMKDYFEKEHAIHGRIVELCDLSTENAENILTNLCVNKEAQLDQDLIKSTPVKVISPKYRKGTTITEQITYDQVLTDAMKKLELCKKPLKARSVLNKTTQESNIFKTPVMSITKSSRSVGYRNVPNKHVQFSTACKSMRPDKDAYTPENSNNVIVYKTKTSTSSILKQDHVGVKEDLSEKTDVQVNNHEDEKEVKEEHTEKHEEQNEEEIEVVLLLDKSEEPIDDDNKKEQNDVVDTMIEKSTQQQTHKPRASVLTWQNGRRSLNKRRGSNRFVSLAEAVSRFQNDTPKRFRTRCNNDHVAALRNSSSKPSMQHHRLKTTIPISPALMSKNRTRAVTILSQEEREKQEMEEMKKYYIKANPIPRNVLRGPIRSMPKTIVKKLTTSAITAEKQLSSSASATQSEKILTSTSVRLKNPGTSHHDKVSTKNTVTKVLVTDPTGIIVERVEIPYFGVPKDNSTARNVTRIVPFSFEARNKDLQIKKEQRLKSLQEASKAKMEFHARPVPNFTKPLVTTSPTVVKQQKKTAAQQCPFSFEERDKNLLKKKEKLTRQMCEEDKRMRVFRANPAPVFKPVTVRGFSKERLLMKGEKENTVDDQENEEPNVISIDKTQENKCMRKIKKATYTVVDKQNTKDKGREENITKPTLSLELNTDKRAKERREFDEKIKRKEMEEEVKRQEDKKRQDENEKQMRVEQRKLAEVKARPMPTYKPLIIAKATKPLTEPQSPMLSNKYRSKQS
ncbi:targeting protein for Xklp2-like [Odontomachus brunneus]|uniref:targeting protein for Xklp2-like n=1 Tax=Odontomachus brunneus TaxID=486640 RepID=UPI0013F1CE4A|nr:targeting protein for Xklp2-like [Odontomachus brunneus]XP_032676671.1 targeting protein for Xklp2-like [Odontomachus brunneus]XP_032676672.1 targeting protein for Xklp2-like [Odontomachus brunneus]XP_032676674.1 targeting protein for Xklp2-like [Odontomachus brunneus]